MTIQTFFSGVYVAATLNLRIPEEKSYIQGRHYYLSAITQISILELTYTQFSKCFKNYDMNSSLISIGLNVIPLSISFLLDTRIKNSKIRQLANFVHDHMSKFSLIVTVTSSIGLFVLGQRVLSVTTLSYLSIGLLAQNNIFSPSIQKIIRHANYVIGELTSLIFGGILTRVIVVGNLTSELANQYFRYQNRKNKSLKIPEKNEKINFDEMQPINNRTYCSIKRSHLRTKCFPFISSGVKITDLLELSNSINWKDHKHVIEAKLKTDLRWLDEGQPEPIKFFKQNLKKFVDSIEKQNITAGQIENYKMLERYCRYIAQELPKKDMITQADTLIKMGIEGGNYCGAGKFEVAEDIYTRFTSDTNETPLNLRILGCLQLKRIEMWEKNYSFITQNSSKLNKKLFHFLDGNSYHTANVVKSTLQASKIYGLPREASKNDSTNRTDYLSVYAIKYFWGKKLENIFWLGMFNQVTRQMHEGYTFETIMKTIDDTIGTPHIPKSDIYKWWRNWIQDQENLSVEVKETLTGQLGNGLFDNEKVLSKNAN